MRFYKNKFFWIILFASTILISLSYYWHDSVPENKKKGEFSTSIWNIHEAKTAEFVHLKDGDTYDLRAEYISKKVGNDTVRMLGYNGSIPGPFFMIDQGATITINFTNKMDVETTIHSHGLRLDFAFDGTPGISQDPIPPGETFSYELKFPDAGTYWYHPHLREDYAQELGLYGNYQVKPTQYELPEVNEEINLIVDDILIEDEKIYPFFKDKTNFAVMGRFGNIMLVNGSTDYKNEFKKGDVVRMYFTNTANVRPFELTIPGVKMKLVGSDLSPYEKESYIEKLLITPSERYYVDVHFEEEGEYILTHTSHDQALGDINYEMATFYVSDIQTEKDLSGNFNQLNKYPHVTESMTSLGDYMYKKPNKNLRMTMNSGGIDLGNAMERLPCHKMPDDTWMGDCTDAKKEAWLAGLSGDEAELGAEKIHWEDHLFDVNENATTDDITWILLDQATEKYNHHINDWDFEVGDVIKVRLFNDPMSPHPMQHPFHMHGQRFYVIATNGIENENKVWKDTTLVQVGDTVDILVEMTNPGVWMAHCHIAEHMHAGMMFNFSVGEEYHNQGHVMN